MGDKSAPSHHLACLNAYCVALSLRDGDLRSIYNPLCSVAGAGTACLCAVDTVGSEERPCDQLSGREIVLHLAKRAKETDHTFYLYRRRA